MSKRDISAVADLFDEYSVVDWYSGARVSVDTLDEGVREVVCRLIDLGATPLASCDGHGNADHWYVFFQASLAVAQRVAGNDYLAVCVKKPRRLFAWHVNAGEPYWRFALCGPASAGWSRERLLEWAVREWLANDRRGGKPSGETADGD